MASQQAVEALTVAFADLTARLSDQQGESDDLALSAFDLNLREMQTYDDALDHFSKVSMGYGNLAVKLVTSYALARGVSPEVVLRGLRRWIDDMEIDT